MQKFLISIDLDQAENRITAYIAPEPRMIEAFESGIDIHSLTAAFIFGKDVSQVSREKGSCELGLGEDSERDWGKRANHSLNYGLGYKAFSFRYELPEAEGLQIVNGFHTLYPGIRNSYHTWVKEALKKRVLTNCYGRKRKFIIPDPEAAYAYTPQSTVADKVNTGLLYIWNNQDIFEPIEILNQIHDEIFLQASPSAGWTNLAHAVLCLKKHLEEPLSWKGREFSIPASVKVGVNAKDMEELKLSYRVDEVAKVLEEAYKRLAV